MIKQLLVKCQYIAKAFFVVVAFLFAFLLILSFVRNTLKVFSAQSKLDEARAKLEEIKKDQEEIKKELSYVESDFYKDKQSRDKLGLSKEGDIVVVLPDDDVLRRLSPRRTEEVEPELPDPNWRKWFNLFF